MTKKIDEIRWELHQAKARLLTIWGLKNGYISPYDEELLSKLRTIYEGGLPASVILLSNGLSNGHCYDRATLLSKAFLDTDDDINLIYGDVDSIKLNPRLKREDDPMYADHCFLERITQSKVHYIYDTSCGFIYAKWLYYLIEHPKVRNVFGKEDIKEYVRECMDYDMGEHPDDVYVSTLILPLLENTYGRANEMYSLAGIEMFQREVELYKQAIGYDNLCKEVEEDMRRKGFIK